MVIHIVEIGAIRKPDITHAAHNIQLETGSFDVWRGFRLVAGVGLFPADCCRRPRRAHFCGTAASGVVDRTTKYGEGPKCESLGQSTCAVDGAECEVPTGHFGRARSSLWLVTRIFVVDHRVRLPLDLARIRFCCVGIDRKPLFLQRGAYSGGSRACGV